MSATKKKTGKLTGVERAALRDLTVAVKAEWPGVAFKLFGSKAKGSMDAESDLDLLVVLPCPMEEGIRRRIISMVFEINLAYASNISALIVSREEWEDSLLSLLPIHASIEREGIAL